MKYHATFALFTLLAGSLGHLYPKSPCPRGSPLAECGYPNPDYNLMVPIGTDNQPAFPLCHHTQAYASPVKTVQAGSAITFTFNGVATHNGGHCEFSLSYDGGKTFVSIHTIIKTCFLNGMSFNVPIPKGAPNGNAVLAWSWVNATGKREFYMTCSDIAVRGGGNGSLKGPKMLTPNYDGSSPKIGEFGLGGDDCSNLYKERPNIVISPGGSTTPSGDQPKHPSVPASHHTETPTATPTADVTPSATLPSDTSTKTADAAHSHHTSTSTGDDAHVPIKTATQPASPVVPGNLQSASASNGQPTCVAIGKSPEYITVVHGQTFKFTCGATLVCRQTEVGGVYCDYA